MLSPEQLKARQGKLTASRVKSLMRGDAEEILQLYLEMIGEAEPEDLSRNFAVRRGEAMEPVILDFYEYNTGNLLDARGEVRVHPDHEWAASTLDGFDIVLQCPVEAKDVGGREPLETVIERYQPQMQWQMFVTGTKLCAFTYSAGAAAPIIEYIDRDDDYIAEMVKRGWQFIQCVRAKRPPIALAPVPAPVIADKTVDMTASEVWQRHAQQWIQVRGAADVCKDSEKLLKSLVPEDAKKCFGWGVRITRDRAGRLSLREDVE